jgi:polar amino acid transport system substrate-binding protein
MKTRFIYWLVLLALVGPAAAAQEAPTVRVMASTSPPYVDRTLPEQGLAVEMARHLFARTPYALEIGFDNWSRAIEGVRVGVYDALLAAWYTDERNADLLFSEPYIGGDLIIVKARNDRGTYTELSDLAGKRLGVQLDYAYGIDFSEVPGLQLVGANQLIENLLNLLNGKVDFVIGDQRTMNQQLHEFLGQQVNKFDVLPIRLRGRDRHLAASRAVAGHREIIAAFNKALAESRKDGSYQAILKKWDERFGNVR